DQRLQEVNDVSLKSFRDREEADRIALRHSPHLTWLSMSEAAASDTTVTTWLHRLRDGDPQALARVLPLVCDELRALARSQLRNGRSAHTLNATALVHEVFLRLNQREQLEPADRRHFFAIAAQAMRRVHRSRAESQPDQAGRRAAGAHTRRRRVPHGRGR